VAHALVTLMESLGPRTSGHASRDAETSLAAADRESLELIERPVNPAQRQELLMRALFTKLPLMHRQDSVGVLDGGEAMRDRRAALHQAADLPAATNSVFQEMTNSRSYRAGALATGLNTQNRVRFLRLIGFSKTVLSGDSADLLSEHS
jgi:hypothetical protein